MVFQPLSFGRRGSEVDLHVTCGCRGFDGGAIAVADSGHSSNSDLYDPDLQMRMLDQRRARSGVQEILDAAFAVVCSHTHCGAYGAEVPKTACNCCNSDN